MVIPAAMNYYSGIDMLKNMDPKWREDQRKEMLAAIPDASDDTISGIELGLATARAILFGSAELVLHGADPNKVL